MSNGTISSRAQVVILSVAIVLVVLILYLVSLHNLEVEQNQAAIQTIEQDTKLIKIASHQFQEKRKKLEETLAEYGAYKTKAEGQITKLTGDLSTAQNSLADAQKKLAETSAKLTTVQNEKDQLSAAMEKMQKQIADYNAQIADLRARLQTETKDKEFLLSQVKDLEAKRDELMKKWNDLAALRSQVRTLVTAIHVRDREQLAEKRGYWGVYQNTGLRNFKTYAEVRKEKSAGPTTIEVYRQGNNPAPQTPPPQQK